MFTDAVGAGSAGCVLANRLSEDEDVTVLVLEAGEEETKYANIDLPSKHFFLRRPGPDWLYRSIPQQYACHGHTGNVS